MLIFRSGSHCRTTQAKELREQLVASIELGQAHFEKNNQMQERLQRQKTMIVKRVINQWLLASRSPSERGRRPSRVG